MIKKLIPSLTLGFLIFNSIGYSQCSGSTPLFVVNLSSSPTSTWTSPSVIRDGNCCSDNNCVAFLITLHPLATEISLNISSGAIPTGALFYQIGCGGMQTVGANACISGVGPHLVTFCKPGNNVNTYTIVSNPVSASPDFTMTETTTAPMYASGLTAGSISWTSIFPGAVGAYNSYLSCTTCSNPTITAPLGSPPIIRYRVTGNAASGCLPITRNDTVSVTILDLPLAVELAYFNGSHNSMKGENNLWWQTTTETNNDGFIIEKSEDAITWEKIGDVDGHINSNTTQSYQFIDETPLPLTYYRLVQKDVNGEKVAYDPISVDANKVTPIELNVYPNPANGDFIVQLNRPVDGIIRLTDNVGRVLIDQTINTDYQIQITSIPPGSYSVILETEGNIYQRRVIIQ